ncbi:transcriptional regulator [Labrys okinawensis]|uniref:Transcriptional regulator n=1 Tax=Labrys okinawensis TaxID=346911 RepID=A0A2S9QJJ0_9HYPH|nr:dimethylsulfoniopropionate lyase [Labrys okinawensis]PRH89515.1 transcriptional regulator [Labrys okinawensis]
MTQRSTTLQNFVDAAREAFGQFAQDPDARRSIGEIFTALEEAKKARSGAGVRLPACGHLDQALRIDTGHATLARLLDSFKAVEPFLQWRRRPNNDGTASANFADGHANAMLLGPGGLEERGDVWLGVSLMAPKVRYPDHDHAPEEVYLVLSDGEFRQGEGDWFAPGVGGSFYNKPGIRHAMRSLETPLFAFWALRADTQP